MDKKESRMVGLKMENKVKIEWINDGYCVKIQNGDYSETRPVEAPHLTDEQSNAIAEFSYKFDMNGDEQLSTIEFAKKLLWRKLAVKEAVKCVRELGWV